MHSSTLSWLLYSVLDISAILACTGDGLKHDSDLSDDHEADGTSDAASSQAEEVSAPRRKSVGWVLRSLSILA